MDDEYNKIESFSSWGRFLCGIDDFLEGKLLEMESHGIFYNIDQIYLKFKKFVKFSYF